MITIRRAAAILLAIAVLLPQYSCGSEENVRIFYAYDHKEIWWAVLSVLMYLAPLGALFIQSTRWSAATGIVASGITLYFRGYDVLAFADALLYGWWVGGISAVVYFVACSVILFRTFRASQE